MIATVGIASIQTIEPNTKLVPGALIRMRFQEDSIGVLVSMPSLADVAAGNCQAMVFWMKVMTSEEENVQYFTKKLWNAIHVPSNMRIK